MCQYFNAEAFIIVNASHVCINCDILYHIYALTNIIGLHVHSIETRVGYLLNHFRITVIIIIQM